MWSTCSQLVSLRTGKFSTICGDAIRKSQLAIRLTVVEVECTNNDNALSPSLCALFVALMLATTRQQQSCLSCKSCVCRRRFAVSQAHRHTIYRTHGYVMAKSNNKLRNTDTHARGLKRAHSKGKVELKLK